MTQNAPTPRELREAARAACEGQPESDLHSHPAWRMADYLEQLDERFLNRSNGHSPAGLFQALSQEKEPDLQPGLEWAIARCKALQSQGFERSRHDVLIKDFQNCINSLTPLPEPAQ